MSTTPPGRPPLQPSFFAESYDATPPWEIGRPQPAICEIAGEVHGSVLDVGCGTGEHALFFAARGLEVTGLDAVPRAIDLAREKAKTRGLQATFVVGDALELETLGRTFDHIIDSGLFHVFDDASRETYVESLSHVAAPGSVLHLLCFSEHTPGTIGPRRVTQADLRAAFAHGWLVDAIDEVEFEIRLPGAQPRAWRARIVRTKTA